MTEYLAELLNVSIPYIANFILTLMPLWKTRNVKSRSVFIFISCFVAYICIGLLLVKQYWTLDLRVMQLYKMIASVPLVFMPYLVFRKRMWVNTFLLFVTAMYNTIAVGSGVYAGENLFKFSANPLIGASLVSLAVIAITLPPLLYLVRRLCENPSIKQTDFFWRFAWMLPATYFSLFLLSGSIFESETYTGFGFFAVRGIVYTALSLTCYLLDVSLRFVVESEAAKRKAEELDKLNKMRTDLMATVAHETRTPLSVLSVYSEIIARDLRKKGVDEQTAKNLDNISDEAHRVAWLMDELQNHIRSQSDGLLKTRLTLSTLIENTVRLYTPIMERKNITMSVHAHGDLPEVYACANEITQVMFNLLQNVRDHSGGDSVSISLSYENGFAVVAISDTGVGISPEILPRVFERGVTGNSGTGLGLTLCKEIIERHGGEIAISCEAGTGTVVRFNLPVWKEDEQHG